MIDTVEWKDLARKTHQRKGLVSYVNQWRSQDIAIAFVRTSARSAEAYRGSGGILPPRILQPPRSVLRPYTVVKCKSLTANSRMMSVLDSTVIWCYI